MSKITKANEQKYFKLKECPVSTAYGKYLSLSLSLYDIFAG
jgi:hypothetical protein